MGMPVIIVFYPFRQFFHYDHGVKVRLVFLFIKSPVLCCGENITFIQMAQIYCATTNVRHIFMLLSYLEVHLLADFLEPHHLI